MTSADRMDLFKLLKAEYATPKEPKLVETTEGRYLAIEGEGEPGGETFSEKLGAMYSAAFTMKMAKKAAGQDYKVCAMEALWWGFGEDVTATPKSEWKWKLLIRTPDFVAQDDLRRTVASLIDKGKPASVADVKLETLNEGPCVQVLHVGPYDQEDAAIQAMVDFARQEGMDLQGRHHEIYLSDPRRVPPERLRTILRRPVRKAGQAPVS